MLVLYTLLSRPLSKPVGGQLEEESYRSFFHPAVPKGPQIRDTSLPGIYLDSGDRLCHCPLITVHRYIH